MNQEHGGNVFKFARQQGCRISKVTDFSASINPLGMSPMAIDALYKSLSSLVHYPDRDCTNLRAALAQRYDLKIEQILIGNGSTELIHLLPRVLGLRRIRIPVPSFSEYEASAMLAGCEIDFFKPLNGDPIMIHPLDLVRSMKRDVEAIILGNPNNPTGQLLRKNDLLAMVREANQKKIRIILDEAFIDYAEEHSLIRETDQYKNLIVLRSFTKFYGMPGLRAGYLVADGPMVERLEIAKVPWSVNHLAQIAASAGIMDESYIEKSRRVVEEERNYLLKALSTIQGITIFPSCANYLMMHLSEDSFQMEDLETVLMQERILVRNCSSFRGLTHRYIRIAVKSRPENEKLLMLLKGVSLKYSKGIPL